MTPTYVPRTIQIHFNGDETNETKMNTQAHDTAVNSPTGIA